MSIIGIKVSHGDDDPIDAADEFYAEDVLRDCPEGTELIFFYFDPAGYEHHAWRLAAIQSMARRLAPVRVNGIVGRNPDEIAKTREFLETAPGVTGQLLTVDSTSAGNSGI